MPSLASRIEFAEKYVTTKDGRPWRLAGREWIRDEFWGPIEGFKHWLVDPERACSRCRARVNTVEEWRPTQGCEVGSPECRGTSLEPVIMSVLNLPRREGKTFNTSAYLLSVIFQEHRKSIMYVASAGEQTMQLAEENLFRPIRDNAKLRAACEIVGNKIRVARTKSMLEIVPTSHGSITGRGRTHLVIDEARDVDARVGMAAWPSVFDQGGRNCPNGHCSVSLDGADVCSACGVSMVPWFGRVIIMSSSGILDGGERDWFADLVTKLDAQPDKNCHLFRLEESRNPDVAQTTKGVMERVFGSLDATRTYVEVEVGNTFRRRGEEFLTRTEREAVLDHRLVNEDSSDARCVAFLDTSRTGDLTSLVILAEDEPFGDRKTKPWERLYTSRIDVWNPKTMRDGVIDPDEIEEHLCTVIPMFPSLQVIAVDVRAMAWAIKMVSNLKGHVGWGRRVIGFKGRDTERNIGWGIFEDRSKARTIRVQKRREIIEELQGIVKIQRPDGTVEVRDRSRKKKHADILEGIASCCYLVHQEAMKKRSAPGASESAGAILDRLWRPVVPKMTPDSF